MGTLEQPVEIHRAAGGGLTRFRRATETLFNLVFEVRP
jgi:hypothetical protein